MARCLEEGLAAARGAPTAVRHLERAPFAGSSSFAAEKVHAVLASGEEIDVFFKDLNPRNQLDEARSIREHGLERSRRELLMYQNVLAPLNLGTPALYGSRWEPSEDRYWLFLEHAGPKRLSRLGDFSLWVEATGWVARLHAIDLSALGERIEFLPRYDDEHFATCAQQIERSLSRFEPGHRRVIVEALARYRESVDYLRALPACLIHGEYFGKNVMIRPGSTDNTIAVIDWETAAIGPRAIDLVSMTAGRWTSEQRAIMCSAYARTYEAETGQPVDLNALYREMAHVGLYRALWWLGYWSRGDDAHIGRWIKELETMLSITFSACDDLA